MVLSRIRGRGWGFRGGHRMDQLLFPLPLACSSATWAERQRRGGERQIRFAPRYPRAVRRGLTTGSFSKTRPAPNAAAAPNRRGTLLRNASPNLTPKRVRFGQQRFSFGPGAARFLWQDQRKWGAPPPVSRSGDPHIPFSQRKKDGRYSRPFCLFQNSALPTVRGWGSTSRILLTPVRYITRRSKPRPKPACLQLP